MKVSELIELLKKLPQDNIIYVNVNTCNKLLYLHGYISLENLCDEIEVEVCEKRYKKYKFCKDEVEE